MTATRGESSSSYEVVAGSREQIQSVVLQTIAIFHYTTHRGFTTLLCTAQRLVLEGRDTTSLIAW